MAASFVNRSTISTMDNFLVRLLFVPIILGAQQIVYYLLRMMTEEVHSPLPPSSANDQVSDIAPSPAMSCAASRRRTRRGGFPCSMRLPLLNKHPAGTS